jgi:4'-phosphopantetheinyl transferase
MLDFRKSLGPEWSVDPPAGWRVPPDELHLWLFSLQPPAESLEGLAGWLDGDERARVARFHRPADGWRFVAARGRLRAILGHYLGAEPAALAFAYGPRGKPALAAPWTTSGIRFNLSHSGALGLLGLAYQRELGVDIEVARPLENMAALARRFFSPAEVAALLAVAEPERPAAFLAGWTRKEAYVKAVGDGLAHSLASFSVSLTPGVPPALLAVEGAPAEATRWSIATLTTLPGYAAAVAAEGQWRLKQFAIDD